MDELHELHAAIIKTWEFIKKYNEEPNTEEVYSKLFSEVDAVRFASEQITELFQNFMVQYTKYFEVKNDGR